MRLPIKQQIVIHVSYRQIFNAPVRVSDCKEWLGIEPEEKEEFEMAIEELNQENLIVVKDGFLSVYSNNKIIDLQSEKERLSDELLAKGGKTLRLLSKLPFIKYIGISGSVAARNPTLSYDKKGNGAVDLDIFVVSKSNCLWPFFLLERIFLNLKKLFKGHHFYCFNYVTDETFLEVHNKNFYTATEIINLQTIYDDDIYSSFLEANAWCKKYYPKYASSVNLKKSSSSLWTLIITPLNFACYALFCIGRGIKRMEIKPIFEMLSGFDPVQKCNLKRISNPNGGYQEAIKKRFTEVFIENFPNYYSEEIMEGLFPSSNAFTFSPEQNVHDKENVELFSKYTLSANEENII